MYFLLPLPSAVLIVGHAGEHDISSMLFRIFILYGANWPDRRLLGRRRRRAGRRRRQESIALGDPGEPVAFPSGVVGRLRAAVKLAGCVKSLLIREGG
jgi:hypothetical protein